MMRNILYHIIFTSSKGLIHKIGISSNFDKRLEAYKTNVPFEDITVVKTREFSSIDEARIQETLICNNFHPIAGREYFILNDDEREKFNDLFFSMGSHREVVKTCDYDLDELREMRQRLQEAYSICYSNLHRLNELNYDILKKIEFTRPKRVYQYDKPRVLPLSERIDQMVKLDKAREIIEKVEVGKSYTKEEFEGIVSDWIKEVKDWYPELKLNHNSIKTLNEFCSRIGYMWESKKCGRASTQYRVYVMSRM